jgi:hypothetical protein
MPSTQRRFYHFLLAKVPKPQHARSSFLPSDLFDQDIGKWKDKKCNSLTLGGTDDKPNEQLISHQTAPTIQL